ncbi:MAG: glycosyltransferase family A protein [Desulfovibrionaceae bacterium]|nr:glycosyltransferase family A protein [Desulfovibrionaceae bacterium]
MKPALSIVIPNHDYGSCLPGLFAALGKQSLGLERTEILFVDDCSSDGSLDLAKALGRGLACQGFEALSSPRRGRPGPVRNLGLTRARGDYLLCMDPDDLPEPGFMSACLRALAARPDAGLAATDYWHEEGSGRRLVGLPHWDPGLLRVQNVLSPCVMIRRAVWEKSRGYRDNTAYEDWDFWVQAAANGFAAALVNEPLFRYRAHPGSYSERARAEDGRAKAMIVLNNPKFFPLAVRRWAAALTNGEPWALPFGRGLIPGPGQVRTMLDIAARAADQVQGGRGPEQTPGPTGRAEHDN